MESLSKFIEDHYLIDKSRSSFSNLIKKIKLENELSVFIENYISFGTFKQKLYHFINGTNCKLYCPVCDLNELNWIERDNNFGDKWEYKGEPQLISEHLFPEKD